MHFRINYLQATSDGVVDTLSSYHFRPDCRVDQANVAADALPRWPPRKTFGASRFWALLSRFWALLFKSRSPSFGSLHFFDPDPTAPDPCLRNTRFIIVVSALGHVSKQTSRRTYKDNVSSMKLGFRAIERRRSGPENQIIRPDNKDRASWIRRLGRLWWGLLWKASLRAWNHQNRVD